LNDKIEKNTQVTNMVVKYSKGLPKEIKEVIKDIMIYEKSSSNLEYTDESCNLTEKK
jgi:hypothetical protein